MSSGISHRSQLFAIYKEMIVLERILDVANQKRKREDKEVKIAWGHAFNIKGLLIKEMRYWQPTLLTVNRMINTKSLDKTWTKKNKELWRFHHKIITYLPGGLKR